MSSIIVAHIVVAHFDKPGCIKGLELQTTWSVIPSSMAQYKVWFKFLSLHSHSVERPNG